MLCAKFGAHRRNHLEGLRKSRFATFCEFAKKHKRETVGGNGRGLNHEIQHNLLNACI